MNSASESQLPQTLLQISKNIKKQTLYNLGGDKTVNDVAKFLANALKVASIKLNKRSLLFNNKDEICVLFPIKTINSLLKLLPNTICSYNLIGMKNIIKSCKLYGAIIDALLNYKKVLKDKNLVKSLFQVTFECIKIFNRTIISNALFGTLKDTNYQFLIGPILNLLIIYIYIPEDSQSPNMDFVRDAAEEISEMILR